MSFKPRLTRPSSNDKNYIVKSSGGYNPALHMGGGSVLPNCVGYAWGRARELMGSNPAIIASDARRWLDSDVSSYPQGRKPKLGAIGVWSGTKYGHVAVVEKISGQGIITISESNWTANRNPSATQYFNTATIQPPYTYSGMTFRGFLYHPGVGSSLGGGGNFAENLKWVVVDKYPDSLLGDKSMKNNAKIVAANLSKKGWSLQAIAAILGNMEAESHINPGMTEFGKFNREPGYGLVQWTPKSKLTKWLDTKGKKHNDGNAQLDRLEYEIENRIQWITKSNYKLSFKEFKVSTQTPEYLAGAFVYNYERPGNISQTAAERRVLAKKWWNYIKNLDLSNINGSGGGFSNHHEYGDEGHDNYLLLSGNFY